MFSPARIFHLPPAQSNMNSANFHKYLRNPSMLHQVSYQELKSLVLQYPYSANLRYLMLLKSLFDNHKEYDRNLTLASLSSIDRKRLFVLVEQYAQVHQEEESFEIAEEFLELKDLSALDDVMEASTAPAENDKVQALPLQDIGELEGIDFFGDLAADFPAVETETDMPDDTGAGEELGTLEDLLGQTPFPDEQEYDPAEHMANSDDGDSPGMATLEELIGESAPDKMETEPEADSGQTGIAHNPKMDLEDTLAGMGSIPVSPKDIPLEVTNDETTEDGDGQNQTDLSPQPAPKGEFESWRQKLDGPKVGILGGELNIFDQPEEEIPDSSNVESGIEEYEEPEDVAKDVADSSILEDGTIATETFAGILERQGHFEKAIAMYEKLSLQYPEKSSFFAAKIDKLRKK